MSLLVWLPLTGDIHNQGLLNVTTSAFGSLTYEDGKIGQAVRIGSGSGTVNKGVEINSNLITNLGTEYSCSVWVKPTGNHTNYEGCIISSGNWNTNTWSFGLNQTNTQVSVMQRGYNNYIACDVPVNTWTHLVSTAKNGVAKLYKNGVYIGSKNIANPELISDANFTRIGNASYTNYFTFNGLISDVRIYNEELSPKQIKLLSQGLVLHYPLSDPYAEGTTNLLPLNSQNFTETGVGAGSYLYNTSIHGSYTLSGYITCRSTDKAWTNPRVTLRIGYSDGTFTVVADSSVIVMDGKERYFSLTATSNTSKTVTSVNGWILDHSSGTTGKDATIRCAQLEMKDHATPYTPSTRNENIIYDVSGYCNNGTINGALTISNNTPKYRFATIFDGNTASIKIPFNDMVKDRNYTISVWTYKSQIGTKTYQTILGGPGGFELEARSGSGTDPLFRIHNWGGGTTPYEFNKWYHFCFVHTDTNSKLYINGELKITGSYNNVPTGNYFIGAWNTATQQNFDGLMSDFRIYTTALSADDILELYNTPVHLTSNGALLTSGELTEV